MALNVKATAIPFIFSCMDVFSTPPGRANSFSSLLKPRGFLISKWWILVLKSHILRLRITAKGNQHLTPHSSQLSQLISPKHSWAKYLREHLTNTVCFNRQTWYKLLLSCLWKKDGEIFYFDGLLECKSLINQKIKTSFQPFQLFWCFRRPVARFPAQTLFWR